MGKQNRRNLDSNFKTKVVLASLKGEKTTLININQLN